VSLSVPSRWSRRPGVGRSYGRVEQDSQGREPASAPLLPSWGRGGGREPPARYRVCLQARRRDPAARGAALNVRGGSGGALRAVGLVFALVQPAQRFCARLLLRSFRCRGALRLPEIDTRSLRFRRWSVIGLASPSPMPPPPWTATGSFIEAQGPMLGGGTTSPRSKADARSSKPAPPVQRLVEFSASS
jgi:hypothetical protein